MADEASLHPEYASVACLTVPVGGRVIVVSDLFLGASRTSASESASIELARALERAEGPGALVIAGNAFDLLVSPGCDPSMALGAHEELRVALAGYLADDSRRRAVLLPGNRDRAVLFDPTANAAVTAVGFEVALTAQLRVPTAAGPRQVCVEPGWSYDERNAFVDPADPLTPRSGITPLRRSSRRSPDRAPPGSRASTGWLILRDCLVSSPRGSPIAASSAGCGGSCYRSPPRWSPGSPTTGCSALPRSSSRSPRACSASASPSSSSSSWPGSCSPSSITGYGTRRAARCSAHRRTAPTTTPVRRPAPSSPRAASASSRATPSSPSSREVGTGFYANTGACGEVVEERPSRLGLPPVFVHLKQVSWVEIEPGAEVHARLLLARSYERPVTLLERFAAGRLPRGGTEPEVVASFPGGLVWPPVANPVRNLRRVRRLAAAGIAVLGLADLVSAVVPPDVRGRLAPVLGYVPLGVSEAAGALVALAGVGLLALARGVRRGQRSAWLVSILLLAGTVALHLIRHGEVVQSAAALALVALLWWTRGSFRARFDLPSLRAGLATLLGGVLAVTFIGATVIWSVLPTHPKGHPISWIEAWWATAGRLVGIRTVAAQPSRGRVLEPGPARHRSRAGGGRARARLPPRRRPAAHRRPHGRHRAGGRRRPAPGHGHARLLRASQRQAVLLRTGRPRRLCHLRRHLPRLARTRSAPRRNATSSGPPFAATPTTTAGPSPCSGRARNGSPSTAARACTSSTSATRGSWT